MFRPGHQPPPPTVHLLRGAPPVRSWSKHQTTAPTWTLCGMRRGKQPCPATETADDAVTCQFCRDLMRPAAKVQAHGA